jgi:SAM-dependent methyltransferase
VSCAVCGGGAVRPRTRVGAVEILACSDCGLAWWTPPAGFRAEAVYDASYFEDAATSRGYDDYAELERSLRTTFARRVARLPRPGRDARLLDVGAAFGFAVEEAGRAGWRAFGLELSAAAAARAGRRAAGRIAVGSALHIPFPEAAFAAVTLWDVLEHLADPHAAAAELARVLAPGGVLALTTGDVESLAARLSGRRWHLFSLPEHLFFYSRRSLVRLLAAHGLRVERVAAEASWHTLGYVVERLRKTLLGRGARAAARWPGAGVALPLNLFDILTVHAVREA